MKSVIDPSKRKQIAQSFYIYIPLADKSDEEIKQALWESKQIEKAVDLMLDGSMSVTDLLESVEHIFPDMDRYADEVEENLEEVINSELWQRNRLG